MALRKAVLEYAAARARKILLAPTVFSRHSTVPFSGLPTVPAGSLDEPATLLRHLLDRLAELDVLAPADAAINAAVDAKVVVPGLEAETMFYGRSGSAAWSGCLPARTRRWWTSGRRRIRTPWRWRCPTAPASGSADLPGRTGAPSTPWSVSCTSCTGSGPARAGPDELRQ